YSFPTRLSSDLKIFAIFLLLSFGFGWTAALYANEAFAGGDVIFTFGWMTLTTGGLQTGLSIMFRSLCFLMMSMMFIFTTDTTQLMMSFIHQCKIGRASCRERVLMFASTIS